MYPSITPWPSFYRYPSPSESSSTAPSYPALALFFNVPGSFIFCGTLRLGILPVQHADSTLERE
jgi:hypothetical protein